MWVERGGSIGEREEDGKLTVYCLFCLSCRDGDECFQQSAIMIGIEWG